MRAKKGEAIGWLLAQIGTQRKECIEWPFGRTREYGTVRYGGRTYNTHRLVCILAHGAPSSGQTDAAHSCGNALCCNPNHIRHSTALENQHDKFAHGTVLRGETAPRAKLTALDVADIKARAHVSGTAMAAEYGVTAATVSLIRLGKTWVHVSAGT